LEEAGLIEGRMWQLWANAWSRYDFTDSGAEGLYVPWSALKPTYRGKEKKDAGKLDLKNVRRFSLMSRRYFTTFSDTAISTNTFIYK
jgi:hypothetical protein